MVARTHEQFLKDFEERQPEIFKLYTVNGTYISNHYKINVTCNVCGVSTDKTPSKLLIGRGCQNCRRLTKTELTDRLSKTHYGWKIDIDYEGSVRQVVTYTCDYGHTGTARLRKMLEGVGCRQCQNQNMRTPETLKKHLLKHPNITLLSQTYTSCKIPLLFSCDRHGGFYRTADSMISKDAGCPICVRDNFRFLNTTIAERNKEEYVTISSNVYFIEIEDIGYKVGISKDPARRFNTISKQSGKKISIIKISESNLYNCILLEDYILNNFKRKDVPFTFDGYKEVIDIDDYSEILLLMDTLT